MDQLRKQVMKAYRRLLLQQFLYVSSFTLSLGLALAAIVIGVDKLYPLGVAPGTWLAMGACLGLLTALAWTFWTRRGPVDAAIEIDRRFGLKERISTALALPESALDTPAGAAVVRDAIRRVSQIDIGERFRLHWSRWSLLPLAPAAIAVALSLFVPPLARQQATAAQARVEVQKQVQNSAKELQKKLAQQREQADKLQLKDAEELLNKLEKATQRDLAQNDLDKKQALVKLNDLSKELEERRQQLANSQSLRQQLNDLKDLNRGPADKFAQAMKEGNVKQALEELTKLQKELNAGKLDEAAKEQLANQLEQMKDKLDKLAQAQNQARQELAQQIAEKRAAGKNAEADELQQKLDHLRKQAAPMQQMQQLAQKFGECAQCMREGNAEGAMQQLAQMEQSLAELEQQLAEADLLEQAMDQIASAKDSMNCKQCQGMGCKACMGSQFSEKQGGQGLGRGQGRGPRPEEAEKTRSYDSSVKQQVGRGAGQVVDFVDGPTLKGGVEQEIATQFEQARQEQANPLTGQRLPKSSQEHAKEYFDALREGR
jgi:hypothetical protein